MGDADYDQLMASVPTVLLHALFCASGFPKLFPGLEDLDNFSQWRQRIATRSKLHDLLIDIEEPGPDQLKFILSRLKSLPSVFKRGLVDTAAQIRPRGGPPEKLSPQDVQRITDELFDRNKDGEELPDIRKDIIKREGISNATLRRRIREERARRAHLKASQERAKD